MSYCERFFASHTLGDRTCSSVIGSCCDNFGLSEAN